MPASDMAACFLSGVGSEGSKVDGGIYRDLERSKVTSNVGGSLIRNRYQ